MNGAVDGSVIGDMGEHGIGRGNFRDVPVDCGIPDGCPEAEVPVASVQLPEVRGEQVEVLAWQLPHRHARQVAPGLVHLVAVEDPGPEQGKRRGGAECLGLSSVADDFVGEDVGGFGQQALPAIHVVGVVARALPGFHHAPRVSDQRWIVAEMTRY